MTGRIAVIGLGATGTAMGLAIRQSALEGVEVAGHDKEPETAKAAHRAGAIDRVELSLLSCVADAHLVIICTPPAQTLEVLGHIGPALAEGAVVTDTIGTKAAVLSRAAQSLPATASFVAGRPIPTLASPGPAASHQFAGGSYCIIADNTTPPEALRDVINLATLLQTTPYFLSLDEHDSYAVAAELLPTLVSTAVLETLRNSNGWSEISRAAGPSLLAVTGAALAAPTTSRDEIAANPELVDRWLGSLAQSLSKLQGTVQESGGPENEDLLNLLAQAHVDRDKLQSPQPTEEEPPTVTVAAGVRQFFLGGLFRGRRR